MSTKFNYILPGAVALLYSAGCIHHSSSVDRQVQEARRSAASASIERENGFADDSQSGAPARLDGTLDLLEAVNLALERNLALRGAFLQRLEARGTIEEAFGAALPNLELTGSAASEIENRSRNPEVYNIALQLTQPLWRSGVVSAGLHYARLNAARAEASIRQQVQQTIARVTRLYLDVLLQQQLVTVYEEAVGTAERMLRTSRTRRTAGTVSDYEILRAEVEVSTANADLLQAQNVLRTSTLELLRALGISQSSEVTLKETLEFQQEKYNVEQVVRAALEHRPDLYMAEAELRMAESAVKVVRGQYGPALDAYLRGVYADPSTKGVAGDGTRKDGWEDDWRVGATLRWTLVDGTTRQGRIRQAEARVGQAANALLDGEEAARVEVVKALLDLRHADELFLSQNKNLELAREALRMLESGFRLGRNTQIEVLDAQSALTAAMGRYYNAIHAHSVARLAVRQAMGLLGQDAMQPIPAEYQLDSSPLTAVLNNLENK